MSKIYAVDLFAGAGGTSTGLIEACEELGIKLNLVAVNHWEKAVKTHEANYPWARHLQADVEAVNPLEAVPNGHLDILVASPECIWYSNAAGGRPMKEQQRTQPWSVFRWLELLDVDIVLIENVPELRGWGPLNEKGRPIPEKKGTIYRAWLRALRAHGYTVEEKILNAADYGASTSLDSFVIAIKGKGKPKWPIPTHARHPQPTLVGQQLKKWRAAREIIDWSVKGDSIFNRKERKKKPLSPRTIQRIVEGLKRFGGAELKPFIIMMEHQGGIRSIDEPLPTITTAKGGAFALAQPQPFLVAMEQVNRVGPKTKSVEEPLWTVSTQGRIGVVEPYILSQASGGAPRPVSEPVPTITTGGAHALIEAAVIVPNFGERKKQPPRAHSIDAPLPTVTSHGAGNLVEAMILPVEDYSQTDASFLTEYYGNGTAESVDEPLHTITTKDRFGLAEASIIQFNGTQESQIKNSAKSIEEPLPTIAIKHTLDLYTRN
jgi:DNA (cytosine-5)-methyltransferase 1